MYIHKNVKWDIIDQCNLRCAHCSVADRYFTGKPKTQCVSADDRRHITNALIEGGIKHISILGGEPFLLGDELFDILGLFKSRDISVSLVSNGLLINEAAMEKLVELGPDRLVFSMEGPDPETHDQIRGKGNFIKLVEIIKDLKALITARGSDMSIHINTVVTRRNMTLVPLMIPFVKSLGADELSLLGLNCVGNASKQKDQLVMSIAEELEVSRAVADIYAKDNNNQALELNVNFIYPLVRDYLMVHEDRFLPFPQICCSAASSLAYINPWGDMHPCDRIFINNYDSKFRPKEAMDTCINLTGAGFHDVWDSEYFMNTFDFVSDRKSYKSYDPCLRCTYFKQKKCNPCPLDAMAINRFPMESCLYVEKMAGSDINSLIGKAQAIDCSLSPAPGKIDESAGNIVSYDRPDEQTHIDRERPVKPIKGIRGTFLNGQQSFILIHPRSGESLFLDTNGFKLWKLINSHPQTVQEICEQYFGQVSAMMNIDYTQEVMEKVHGNVETLVDTLIQKQFIVNAAQ